MVPTTIAVGDVALGSSGMATGLLQGSDADDEIVTLVVESGCGVFTVSPEMPDLNGGSGETITVTFTPVATGPLTCRVDVINGSFTAGSFMVSGTGLAPELSVTTSPVPVSFGSVRVDNAATLTSQRTITIRNTGNADLSISAMALGGMHPGDYAITSPTALPLTVPPDTDQAFTVVFDPDAAGARTASLDLTSNDPASPTTSIALTGTGTTAIIGVTDVAFGIVDHGATETQSIAISNSGTGTLSLTQADIAPTTSWFTFATGGGCTAGETSCVLTGTTAPATVTVGCSPPQGASGTQAATVTFTSDTDTGGDAVSSLSCTAGRPEISVDQVALAFGNVTVGATGTLALMISNTGNAPLTYSLVEQGSNPDQFAVMSPGCTSACTLASMSTATITVTFSPTSIGAKSLTLHIASDDPDTSTLAISLSGTGIAGHTEVVAPTSISLAFGAVEVGATSTSQLVRVRNSGMAELVISNASLSNTHYVATAGTLGVQTLTLGPSETADWMIACEPEAQGAVNGTFTLVSNSDGIPGTNHVFSLTCSGQRGVLAITAPASHDFGGVAVGEVETHAFTLRNTGNVPVTNISITPSVAGGGYSLTAPALPITSLAAGASVTVTVQFAPMASTDGGPVTFTAAGTWGTSRTAMTTFSVNGDGLAVGFDVTPATIDFGELRWDTTPTRIFCIVNTSEAPLDIVMMTVSPAVGTSTTEFTLPTIHRRACGSTTTNPVTLPETLTNGQTLEVIVRADPMDRVGAMAATVTVISDLAVMPNRTVALTGTSTTAMLTTTPGMTVDLGDVDVDGGPASQTITITNTGGAPLDLGAFTRTDVTGGTNFTVTLPGATVLPDGGTLDVIVTYAPTSEHAPGQGDEIQLGHTIAGVLNGPTMQMITIRGRGIDRHIELAPAPAFPDTFRNPGSDAPVRPVTVTNSGEAPLQITAIMITNDDVWQVDTAPVDIPGGGTHEFPVTFTPKVAGKAPDGELALMSDDDENPLAVVLLTGNGLDRAVTMGDPVIDLGYTGIGIPVTLDDALAVTSMDPTHDFVIDSIVIEDPAGVFSIEGAPVDVPLASSSSVRFDVTFTPDTEGQFESRAILYLDDDSTPHAEVTLRGTAVFVDVGGGGGCQTGGGTGAGAAGGLLALLLLRRRRRRVAAVATIALVCLALPATSHAQSADLDLDLALFSPTPSTTGTYFQLQPATVGDNGTWVASATVSYATNPLVLRFAGNEHLSITRRTAMQLGLAYAFLDRFEAGLRMPLYSQDGEGAMVGVASPSGTARGDLVAHVRAQLARATLGTSELAAGASLQLTIPTATEQQFAGVDKPSGRALALVSFTPGALRSRMSLTANAGAVIRSSTQLSNIEQGSGLAWGLGASFRVLDALWATGELFGDVLPGGRRTGAMAPASTLVSTEFLVGLSYRPERRIAIGFAAGRGIDAGLGTADLRGVFSLAFIPGRPDPKPIYPPPPPKIDGDQDGDGVRDSMDACADQAEDMDLFEDEDGCPDPDNDGDSLIDANDKCPLDAEDTDGFEDTDGCPDKDNDADGVADAQDKCPMAAEDKDAHDDVDGCPEQDNDGDGLLDDADKCPNEEESINGVTDDDGCPDRGDSLVVLTPSGLELLEPIQFAGARVSGKSTNVLNQIGATLRARSEIVRLKIVVHVHPSGDGQRDLAFSDRRAQAVRAWLIDWGVAQGRLSAQGMGGKKPLVPRGRKQAALLNQRVELIILERK